MRLTQLSCLIVASGKICRQCLRSVRHLSAIACISLLPLAVRAQVIRSPDISNVPTLNVVPCAHLDTQWRGEFPQTISEYLLKTMRVNFDYIDRYPHYVFNWTGANRYRLMKEYFPADYARMQKYVATGRWFPAGSSIEEGDVNLPRAEGIFRQILYGMPASERISVRRAQNSCCLTASDFLLLPRAFWHTQG